MSSGLSDFNSRQRIKFLHEFCNAIDMKVSRWEHGQILRDNLNELLPDGKTCQHFPE